MILLYRFVLGGVVVAALPVVAARVGPRIAGVLVLVPVVTLCGFVALNLDQGPGSVHAATKGSLIGLPALVGYLVVLRLSIQHGIAFGWSMTLAVVAWTALAALLAWAS